MKKGFTLVELLAVVGILAVIAVITVPIILNVIRDSKKSIVESTANSILQGIDKTVANALFEGKNVVYPLVFKFDGKTIPKSGEIVLQFEGANPDSGKLLIYEDGSSELAIERDQYCALSHRYGKTVMVVEEKCEANRNYWIHDFDTYGLETTNKGVTITYDPSDQTYKVVGTVSGTGNFAYTNRFKIPAKVYSAKTYVVEGSMQKFFGIIDAATSTANCSTRNYLDISNAGTIGKFTNVYASTCPFISLQLYSSTTGYAINTTFKFMVTEGNAGLWRPALSLTFWDA